MHSQGPAYGSKVDVALVFQEMLGFVAALEYLALNNVSIFIAMRVLTAGNAQRRAGSSFVNQSECKPTDLSAIHAVVNASFSLSHNET